MKSTVRKICQSCKISKSLSDFIETRQSPMVTMESVRSAKLKLIRLIARNKAPNQVGRGIHPAPHVFGDRSARIKMFRTR
jgi:hypothetical protein